jgi:hypothetical protein
MPVIKATIAPQSEVARFVLADIKGGESAHNYRMAIVARAILEAYKGNPNNLTEAKTFSAGKSRKAKAYQAAFEALPTATKLPYVGKWDAAVNADIRAEATKLCAAAEFAFESAFLTATVNAKLEADAVKAAKPAAEEAPAEEAEPKADPVMIADVQVDIGAAVEAVAQAVQQGLLQADEMVMLRASLAVYDASQTEGQDVALSALLAATPVLLQAQAH